MSPCKTGTIIVRRPCLFDAPGLADLFAEMQRHYERPVPDSQAAAAAALACKPVESTFDPRVLVAVIDEAIVGSIVLNVSFPAYELTRSLYIRDLYVAAAARRRGVGRLLVIAAARLTVGEGFSALDWTTEARNSAARAHVRGVRRAPARTGLLSAHPGRSGPL